MVALKAQDLQILLAVVSALQHGGAVVDMKLADCMTRAPQTIGPDVLASEALTLMEKRRITCVIVVDSARKVLGVVHLHDLWGMQLV